MSILHVIKAETYLKKEKWKKHIRLIFFSNFPIKFLFQTIASLEIQPYTNIIMD